MKTKCLHLLSLFLLVFLLSVSGSVCIFADTVDSTAADSSADGSSDASSDTRKVIIAGGKRSEVSDPAASGPGVVVSSDKSESDADARKGESLGIHTITGYDPTVGTMTYSGKIAQPNHTIAADLSIYPLGTKLWINGIIYEVEDCGSMVVGKFIDIFYATHEEAEALGMTKAEVFRVNES